MLLQVAADGLRSVSEIRAPAFSGVADERPFVTVELYVHPEPFRPSILEESMHVIEEN